MAKAKIEISFEDSAWLAENYRDLLIDWIERQPNEGRGAALRLAERMDIQRGLLSKVLHGERDLTYEQALAAAQAMGLDRVLTDQFLDLVQVERSGRASATGKHLLDRIQRRKLTIIQKGKQKKLQTEDLPRAQIEAQDKVYYFSTWIPGMICAATRLPGISTEEKVAEFLRIDVKVVREHVARLIKLGLLSRTSGGKKLEAGLEADFEAEGEFSSLGLRSYRVMAMEEKDRARAPVRWFYSGGDVFTRKQADAIRLRLKEMVREIFYEQSAIATKETAEEIYVMNLDWFPLGVSKPERKT